jgi:uncharacterized protein with PIN domain
MERGTREVLAMENRVREDLKKEIEKSGLKCDCGENVYEVGKGAIEHQANYNKYFEYLKCPQCQKLYYL